MTDSLLQVERIELSDSIAPLDGRIVPEGRFTALPLLSDPGRYEPCSWELNHSASRRDYWIDLFRRHFPSLLAEAARVAAAGGEDEGETRRRGEECRRLFFAYLDTMLLEPGRYGRLDVIHICWARENALRRCGIDDAYLLAKQRENEASLKLLPALLAEIDAMPEADRPERLMRGVFAGNIFDLGATKTAEMFKDKAVDFHQTLAALKPRPWAADDLDAWVARLSQGRAHRAAVLFVDNAGPDVLLGMLPLARELLRRGTQVILTANTTPSLNDITAAELTDLVDRIGEWDRVVGDAMRSGAMEVIASGNGAPLIDLRRISVELAEAVARRGVDLVVLEGMGRAIESNWHARFQCDVIKTAMIKDIGVGRELSWQLYDLVLRYEPATVG